jgi:DNA-binding SARP family transcriptional activator
MDERIQAMIEGACNHDADLPVMVCLLGDFRLLVGGTPVLMRAGGKGEALLTYLGLQWAGRVPRERLVQSLWPNSDEPLGLRSLNTLVYNLHKQLGPALDGAAPVMHEEGCYCLNLEVGIGVDVACFDGLIERADRNMRSGDHASALHSYRRAAELYRDDLALSSDPQMVVERERLRARYLTLLAQVADQYYRAGEYASSLEFLWRLLARDSCREDAHRLVMRCYVKRGERAAALHHYQLCADLLQVEFDVSPEPATVALFDQIRSAPEDV